jgi:hypothetical protein
MLFDFRQIVHSRVMPTRHLVKLVRALHHANRQGNIRSMYIMMWQMLAVPMVSANPNISYGVFKFQFRVCSGHSLLFVFKVWNIGNFFTLNPAKFYVRHETSNKEGFGITIINFGRWNIQRKCYPSTTVSVNAIYSTFELNLASKSCEL